MQGAGVSLGSEFRHRLRASVIGLAVYIVVLGAIKLSIGWPGADVTLVPPDGRAAALVAPVSWLFFYCLAVFSFGLEGDLAGRPSIFPSRMFTLPVTNGALAGWPMLYGTLTVASLWLAVALFASAVWGVPGVPFVWPALLLAVFLAWTQALAWMPYGVRGLRVVFTVLWLVALDTVVLLAVHFKARESLMIAFLAPQLPLAFFVARAAVARARRGEVPDWLGASAVRAQRAIADPHSRGTFRSAARAQAWFEWRQHGRTLPALVAIVVPFMLALLFIPGNDAPEAVFGTLVIVLLTPPFLAVCAAAAASKANPFARDALGITPFSATRPLTSAALVAAKLRMALGSAIAAWLVVLAAAALALAGSGTWPLVSGRVGAALATAGTLRSAVFLLLVLAGLVTWTWKLLVQSLCIGLTGRAWFIRAGMVLSLAAIILLGPLLQWIHDERSVRVALWSAGPWILAGLVAIKMCAAAWIATRVHRTRALADRAMVGAAAGWTAAVLALYALLAWLVGTTLIPSYLLVITAILCVPLARLSAAPLALAWNRHR